MYPGCLPQNVDYSLLLGGLSGCGADLNHYAGNGGKAGSGGIVKVSNGTSVYAFNGNRYTDGTSYNDGLNQALIYAQQGIGIAQCDWTVSSGYVKIVVVNPQRAIIQTSYVNPKMSTIKVTLNNKVTFLTNASMEKQGIGSGAGFIEISNGTYTIDPTLD